ncbi:Gfo/Idh/MocA family protein [Parablautia muri]|uniref:Gfo/Idh/MocA family oxidoreductase n=1 Tax=Parablautia muri TaxID=2320879 RepID=A0A9X5GQS5_9FIRM|nr:Gfo/Idh/MocA family oxidoreductase [Parablautia muri]NBJ92528.1 gfo/Idh/MocA family oxidoreductase [Parablautia muri]
MKFLFIGLGSIARQHINNLKELCPNGCITVFRSGKGKRLTRELGEIIDRTVYNIYELEPWYDAVFITNPTSMHYDSLCRYQDKSDHFFIEKPVFQTGTEDIRRFLESEKTYYVACPLRYTNVIQYVKKNIDFSSIYSIRCISSSYLPDWRPGIDYRDTYSAHKRLGGGVSIDLIHEWDYLHYLVGKPRDMKCFIRRKSDLEIDSDDIAVYIAEYEDKIVELHLDYFGKETIRKIELFANEDTIIVDLIKQQIEWLKQGKRIELQEERNEFQKRELKHFFNIMGGQCICDNDLENACEVLRIARGII